MRDFDQKRADHDAILYNTDGRLFDLHEQDARLELVPRSANSRFMLLSIWFGLIPLLLTLFFLKTIGAADWVQYVAMGLVIVCGSEIINRILVYIGRSKAYYEPKRWIWDKPTGQFRADEQQIAPLGKIVAVSGWKKNRRFLLAVRLSDGQEIRLGLVKFAYREWAWRQDAAQIAAFLNVPLEIPPF